MRLLSLVLFLILLGLLGFGTYLLSVDMTPPQHAVVEDLPAQRFGR